jgi:hypothetical protein
MAAVPNGELGGGYASVNLGKPSVFKLALTNFSPLMTASMPNSISCLASILTMYPRAPRSKASLTTSEEDSWVKNRILDWGLLRSIWRAASIPFIDGRPTSIRIRSGRSSSAFCTAADPSDTSPRTINSARSLIKDRTFIRKGSKSSTRRMRTSTEELLSGLSINLAKNMWLKSG